MCPYMHLSSTVTVSNGKVVISLQGNPTGITDTMRFCFRICQSIPDGATGLPVVLVVNGANVPLWNKFGDIVTGNVLKTRYTYKGYYGIQTTTTSGTTATTTTSPHIIALNTPSDCACNNGCY